MRVRICPAWGLLCVVVTGQTAREASPLSKALGIVILAERNAAGLSREQVESVTGVSYSTIRRIEAGERVPTVTQVRDIADALDMRASELMRLAEERLEREAARPARPGRGVRARTAVGKRPVGNDSVPVDNG